MAIERTYSAKAAWEGERWGKISTGNNCEFRFSAPPEFNGNDGVLNPEDALIASESMCMMLTILTECSRRGIEPLELDVDAIGTLGRIEKGKFAITKLIIKPRIKIKEEDLELAKEAVEISHPRCFITNTLNCEVLVEPEYIFND